MGLTSKANSPALCNTQVADLVADLEECGVVDVYDSLVDSKEAPEEYEVTLISRPAKETYDGVVVSVVRKELVDCLQTSSETTLLTLCCLRPKHILRAAYVNLRL